MGQKPSKKATPPPAKDPLEELFETADVDKSGSIDVKELSTLMTVAGIGGTASEALYGANILNPIDDEFDGVPTMDCTEFCLFMKEKLGEDAGKVAKQMKDMLALRALFETGTGSQDAFRASDADGDGSLDVAELSKLMAAAGIGGSASDALYDANINDVFSHDFTDVAKMDYTEFLLFMKDKLGDTAGYAAAQMKEMTALKSLFDACDKDKSGSLDVEELKVLIKEAKVQPTTNRLVWGSRHAPLPALLPSLGVRHGGGRTLRIQHPRRV